MEKLHNNGEPIHGSESDGNMAEISVHNKEDEFVSILVNHIMEILHVGWPDKRIVGALLNTDFKKVLSDRREGLLQQYLHTQLDIIADTIRREFELNETVEVNYSHATHAKFSDLLRAIRLHFPSQD